MISNQQLEREYDDKWMRYQAEKEAQCFRPTAIRNFAGVRDEALAALRSTAEGNRERST